VYDPLYDLVYDLVHDVVRHPVDELLHDLVDDLVRHLVHYLVYHLVYEVAGNLVCQLVYELAGDVVHHLLHHLVIDTVHHLLCELVYHVVHHLVYHLLCVSLATALEHLRPDLATIVNLGYDYTKHNSTPAAGAGTGSGKRPHKGGSMPKDSAARRSARYQAKLKPERVKEDLEANREQMIQNQKVAMEEIVRIETAIKSLLASEPVPSVQYIWYLDFGRQVHKLMGKFSGGYALQTEVTLLMDRWVARHLDRKVLERIRFEVFSPAT
jgi:hypothetical protein